MLYIQTFCFKWKKVKFSQKKTDSSPEKYTKIQIWNENTKRKVWEKIPKMFALILKNKKIHEIKENCEQNASKKNLHIKMMTEKPIHEQKWN